MDDMRAYVRALRALVSFVNPRLKVRLTPTARTERVLNAAARILDTEAPVVQRRAYLKELTLSVQLQDLHLDLRRHALDLLAALLTSEGMEGPPEQSNAALLLGTVTSSIFGTGHPPLQELHKAFQEEGSEGWARATSRLMGIVNNRGRFDKGGVRRARAQEMYVEENNEQSDLIGFLSEHWPRTFKTTGEKVEEKVEEKEKETKQTAKPKGATTKKRVRKLVDNGEDNEKKLRTLERVPYEWKERFSSRGGVSAVAREYVDEMHPPLWLGSWGCLNRVNPARQQAIIVLTLLGGAKLESTIEAEVREITRIMCETEKWEGNKMTVIDLLADALGREKSTTIKQYLQRRVPWMPLLCYGRGARCLARLARCTVPSEGLCDSHIRGTRMGDRNQKKKGPGRPYWANGWDVARLAAHNRELADAAQQLHIGTGVLGLR